MKVDQRIRWYAISAGALMVILCVLFLRPGGHALEGSPFALAVYALSPLIPLVICALRSRESRGIWRITYALAAATFTLYLLGTTGSVLWAIFVGPLGFPSLVDYMYIAVYVSAAVTTLLGTSNKSATYILDGLIIVFALLFIAWGWVLEPIQERFAHDSWATVIALSSPILDIVLVSAALMAVQRGTSLQHPKLVVPYTIGLMCDTVGDLHWANQGMTQPQPGLSVILWTSSLLFIGLGFLYRTEEVHPEVRATSLKLMLMPYIPVVGAVVAGGAMVALSRPIGATSWAMAAVVGICLLIRQLLAVLENTSVSKELETSLLRLRAREQELEHLALHDPLTTLPNRRYLSQSVYDMSEKKIQEFSVVLIDVDDFKLVNDRLGHDVGDAFLIYIADGLRKCVRKQDTVARLGGDEFAILMPNTPEDVALRVTDRIFDYFMSPMDYNDELLEVRLSVGLASGKQISTFDLVLRHADEAMYERKRAVGKGGVAIFS